MKYTQIRDMDISNGEGIGIALFTQGCPYHCKNCFNPETWDFESGKDWNQETENLIIELMKPDYIKRLKDGKVKIDTVRDFTQLVRLDMELCGYVGEIVKEQKVDEDAGVEVIVNISDGENVDEDSN